MASHALFALFQESVGLEAFPPRPKAAKKRKLHFELLEGRRMLAGEVLYNGIVLPDQWPPLRSPTQAYQLAPYLVSPPSVINIDVGRQLFVDDFLIASSTLTRTQHRPDFYPGNPVLAPTGPDSNNWAMPYSDGIWFDPADGLFKMWYMGSYGNSVSYAYSQDGVNWTKPVLPNSPVAGTNVVVTIGGARDSDTVWMDQNGTDPSRKFRLFAYTPPNNLSMWHSADGIQWTKDTTTIYTASDRTTMFFNPFRNVWVESMRMRTTLPASGDRTSYFSRARFYSESPDLATWNPAQPQNSFWAGPDVRDPSYAGATAYPELYNLDAVAYESVLVGMFSWFYPDPNIVELGAGFSRDGYYWERPTRGSDDDAFIPVSNQAGTWNAFNTQSAGGAFLVVGDELWFYFSARSQNKPDSGVTSTGLAKLRRDGFYSMDAGATEGVLTTRTVRFSGNHMFVNVDDPQGQLQVEILDANGNVIAPFTRANSQVVSVDKTMQEIRWNGVNDLSSLAGSQVKFRFYLQQGSLYSFWVTPNANGASYGYVAAGGPGFTGPIDTVGGGGLPSNTPPTLTTINTLTGATEDQAYTITYAAMAAAANEADANGDPISFRVESISSGTLTKNGSQATPGTFLNSGESLVWTPAANASGMRGAFTTRAWDGQAASTFPVQVNVSIAGANDPPTLTTISTLSGATQDMPYSITYAALAAAANEADPDGDAVSFRVDVVSSGALTKNGAEATSGTLLSSGETLVWTPPANTTGTLAAFTVKAWDGQTLSTSAVQTNVTVNRPSTGEVAIYLLDEGSGTTANDTSGNGNNTALTNGPTWVNIGGHQALNFDGVNDYVGVTPSSRVNLSTQSFTLAAWIKTATSTDAVILKKYNAAGNAAGYILAVDGGSNGGRLRLQISDGLNGGAGLRIFKDTRPVNDNAWHHVAVSVERGVATRFYIDGVLSTDRGANNQGNLSNIDALGIGQTSTYYGGYFSGAIDEVRIFDRALSASAVAALAGSTPPPSDNTPPAISGVSPSNVTGSGAQITWSTDEPSTSQVEYGTTSGFGSTTPLDSNLVLNHSVFLTNLNPSATYYYRVKSQDQSQNLRVSSEFNFTTTSAPPPPPSGGALATYLFNEGAGATAADTSGNANNASLLNGPSWVNVGGRQALNFDGANDYVGLSASNRLNLTTQSFTLSAWIKTATNVDAVVLKKYNSAGRAAGYILAVDGGSNGGRLRLQISDGLNGGSAGLRIFKDTRPVNDNVWHHVAVTIERGVATKFYIDGVLSTDGGANNQGNLTNVDTFGIGQTTIYYGRSFPGQIDEVRVFDRSLSAGEVSGLGSGTSSLQANQAAAGDRGAEIAPSDLKPIADEAIARWVATGLTSAQSASLKEVQFQIRDLGASRELGNARPGLVEIDDDAAGHGWFIDLSPRDDNEFSRLVAGSERRADTGSPAAGKMDLLTLVMHELGHELGLADLDSTRSPHNLMTESIGEGARRSPAIHQASPPALPPTTSSVAREQVFAIFGVTATSNASAAPPVAGTATRHVSPSVLAALRSSRSSLAQRPRTAAPTSGPP